MKTMLMEHLNNKFLKNDFCPSSKVLSENQTDKKNFENLPREGPEPSVWTINNPSVGLENKEYQMYC